MKRIIIKYAIFFVLIVILGVMYFFSNEDVRNILYGIAAGVISMIIANKISKI